MKHTPFNTNVLIAGLLEQLAVLQLEQYTLNANCGTHDKQDFQSTANLARDIRRNQLARVALENKIYHTVNTACNEAYKQGALAIKRRIDLAIIEETQ